MKYMKDCLIIEREKAVKLREEHLQKLADDAMDLNPGVGEEDDDEITLPGRKKRQRNVWLH